MAERDPHDYYEPDDDAPDLDDPENRLHFDELHTLVREAAREAWEARDYHRAVIAAWTALRNRLRERLGSNADGVELIAEINGQGRASDAPPRLPLTDFDSKTTRGMHFGLVELLRGIVQYVRNPEQHEHSLVAGDRIGAFERLALLSLCAQHVDVRTEPISVEDALDELRQERFADDAEGRAELIQAVRAADHAALATALVSAAQAGEDAADFSMASRCRAVHRQLSVSVFERGRRPALGLMATEIDRLVSRDQTLDFAIRFVTPPILELLAARNRRKVVKRILEDVETGTRTNVPVSGIFHRDAARIFPALLAPERSVFLRCIHEALTSDGSRRRTYGVCMCTWICRHLDEPETTRIVAAIAKAIIAGHQDVVDELARHRPNVFRYRRALREELERSKATSAEGKALVLKAHLVVEAPAARVRRVRNESERHP